VGEAKQEQEQQEQQQKQRPQNHREQYLYLYPTNSETENKAIETKRETALRKTIKFNETKTQQKEQQENKQTD